METKIPVYECKIMGADNTGIFALSFVDLPANEKNFVALTKKARPVVLKLDKQKQVLTGAVLVPDQLIYRYDNQLGEYYIKFTADDIEKISHKMMRTGLALSTTTHQHEKPLKGNYLVECWVVSNPKMDKAVELGLGELPKGTLVASYKITDAAYWRTQVLAGKVKGFSIEGIFNFKNVKMSTTKKPTVKAGAGVKLSPFGLALQKVGINVLLVEDTAAAADDLADVADDDEVNAGEPVLIFELADGGEVIVDSEGFATLEGETMPAGDHALADGNFIVIDDSGMLVVTTEEAEGAEPAAAATELARTKAKARAKAFLSKKKDPNAAKIANLEKQLAALKAEPSTDKAKPKVAGAGASATGKERSEMSHTEKMAEVIRLRRERQDAKKTGK